MLTVISPAKSLDFETPAPVDDYTQPDYLKESSQLISVLKDYSPKALSQLMGISDKLAQLNAARYASFKRPFTSKNAKAALFTFTGDVYQGLEANTLTKANISFAQDHLRILSGLYGSLRPLDLMQPYRLEMGTKLKTPKGETLYQFWGDKITAGLNKTLSTHKQRILVNLASNEYFNAINTKSLEADVITPVFKDKKSGTYKIISFYAKKARGMMARYIVTKKINTVAKLKGFDLGGYEFNESLSSSKELVFTRDQ